MSPRSSASMSALISVTVVMSLAPARADGQAPTAAISAAGIAAKTWTPPRTPWGEPDLQGVWGGRNQTRTPLERPDEYRGREFLTDEEIAARERAERELQAKKTAGEDFSTVGRRDLKESPIAGNEYNTFWVDTGFPARVFKQTSLITGPEGKIPYKPEVRERIAYSAAVVSSRPPADFRNNSWADRDMGERCITGGNPGSLWQGTGPSQILQGPGYVAIMGEQFRDLRIIPTDHLNLLGGAAAAAPFNRAFTAPTVTKAP